MSTNTSTPATHRAINADDADAIPKLEAKLKALEERQTMMKSVNAYYPWLKQADSVALQVAVLHLRKAFDKYEKRRSQGLPVKLRYKSKNDYTQSYRRESGGRHVVIVGDGDKVKIAKLGLVKIRLSQPIDGRIIAGTITRVGFGEDARYYISFCYEPDSTTQPPPKTGGRAVGIDLGLESFAVTSDGDRFVMPDFYGDRREKLDKLYNKMRRQEQGSDAWERTYNQVRRIKEKISNQRTDFFHKLTLELVRRYDIICIETLDTRDMIRRKPSMKHAIQSAAWGEFVRILEYKCKKFGCRLKKVPGFYPSTQLCSDCGYQYHAAANLKVRAWTCPVCQSHHDRDFNSSLNILREGLRLLEEENADT